MAAPCRATGARIRPRLAPARTQARRTRRCGCGDPPAGGAGGRGAAEAPRATAGPRRCGSQRRGTAARGVFGPVARERGAHAAFNHGVGVLHTGRRGAIASGRRARGGRRPGGRPVREAAGPADRMEGRCRWLCRLPGQGSCSGATGIGSSAAQTSRNEVPAERGRARRTCGRCAHCDTKSHVVSEFRRLEVRRDAEDVTSGQCSRSVPASTCVAGNGWVRSSGESPRAPAPTGCHRRGEGRKGE